MAITPRPYQKEAIEKGIWFFKNTRVEKPKLIIAPTAAGKSIIIAAIAAGLEGRVLVLQPSKELLEQNFAKYCLYDSNVSIWSASAGQKKLAKVTYATIGSIVNVASIFNDYTALIIDEAHLYPASNESMFGKFIAENPQLKILGLTATPFRLKTTQSGAKLVMMHNSNIYNGYYHIIQIQDIAPQYWAPLEYIVEKPDLSVLKINTTGAEYTEASLERFGDNLGNSILRYCAAYPDISKLVFVPSVKQAAALSKSVSGSAYVCAKTPPKERAKIIADFRAGIIKTVFNVNVLSVGFDYPELEMIIDSCPTLSLARHYQKVGRLTRQHQNKEKGIVVDLSGNTEMFGRVEDIRFEKIGISWHIFSKTKQLTGIYYGEKQFVPIEKPLSVFKDIEITFGKFKGQKISEVPEWWMSWALDNLDGDWHNKLKQNIRLFLESKKEVLQD